MIFKVKLLCLLSAMISVQGISQEVNKALKDNLILDKDKKLSAYLPMNGQVFKFSVNMMPLEEVQTKLETFRASIASEIDRLKTNEAKALAQKDLDYYIKKKTYDYLLLYGIDSIGLSNYVKILTEKKADPNYNEMVAEAFKKAYVKTLDDRVRKIIADSLNLQHIDWNNDALFKRSAAFRVWIEDYMARAVHKYNKKDPTFGFVATPAVKLRIIEQEVPTGFIKEQLTYKYNVQKIQQAKDQPARERIVQEYVASKPNGALKKDMEIVLGKYKAVADNAISPDFNYQDINGKMHSLKSLRGKYVYIDIWATWCAPCKAEIPSLKKLEEEYAGKNIQFVSISVDRIADKQKWSSFVKDSNLTGVQLMSDQDFKSPFIQKFNINAIPRFILIDPKGMIVSGNAKRPSDPELKKQLETLL